MAALDDDRSVIFKICSRSLWDEAKHKGSLAGSETDLKDGFMHFSTAAQLPRTLALYFSGQTNLVSLEVAVAALEQYVATHYTPGEARLQWDFSSSRQEYFAHLYGAPLPVDIVTKVTDIQQA